LVAGVSALMAAAHAEEMYRGGLSFAAVYPGIATVAAVSLVLVFGPGLVFVPDLLACRQRGFVDYMGLASRYVQDFEQKWLAGRSGDRSRHASAASESSPAGGRGRCRARADLAVVAVPVFIGGADPEGLWRPGRIVTAITRRLT
jgi:hypothetical protein